MNKYTVQPAEGYATNTIVAGVVIKQDGKYLLIQENRPNTDVHGLWNFPAGQVDLGSSIEDTAIQEAKEEAGVDVELIRKIDIFQSSAETPPQHAFEAKIIGGEIKFPEDEILDAKWFTFEDIQAMANKLRGEWVLGAIGILENQSK
jgi:8-oxo-dGTP pyrophosphatase MutT (NUDIX family)